MVECTRSGTEPPSGRYGSQPKPGHEWVNAVTDLICFTPRTVSLYILARPVIWHRSSNRVLFKTCFDTLGYCIAVILCASEPSAPVLPPPLPRSLSVLYAPVVPYPMRCVIGVYCCVMPVSKIVESIRPPGRLCTERNHPKVKSSEPTIVQRQEKVQRPLPAVVPFLDPVSPESQEQ